MKLFFFVLCVLAVPVFAACNTTNYHEFSCHDIEASTTFEAAASALHVHPTKLREYNREIANDTIPKGASIRVPLDECTPKLGAWGCYEVQAGDTLDSVSDGSASVVRNVTTLTQINTAALWGESKLYQGMHLRMPVVPTKRLPGQNPGCYPDGRTVDCHKVLSSAETLQTLAELYKTTAGSLARSNQDVLGGLTSLTKGMLLRVPNCFFGIDSSGKCNSKAPTTCTPSANWECYTVKPNDTLFKISRAHSGDPYDICDVNSINNCSELTTGQLLTVPRSFCEPRPGFWSCVDIKRSEDETPVISWADYAQYGDRPDLFCRLNNQLADCRSGYGSPRGWAGVSVRMPVVHCFPDAVSYCEDFANDKFPWIRDPYNQLRNYGDNPANFGDLSSSFVYAAGQPVQVPRGSFHGFDLQDCGGAPAGCEQSDWCNLPCDPTPGSHICHRPTRTYDLRGRVVWNDTVASIAKEFGMEWQALCALNRMKNCSCLPSQNVALKVPVS
jgi:LysM repeat protein